MNQPLTLQDVILRLQSYWAAKGALVWQPYHTELGAGTGNPATFLRVLGPEAWNVAYVEPSIRPDDSRYGENPNRLQMHTQFQVILKPDPGNPQELYLESLAALGIDRTQHDIRFVEDNWESPALGAWGLGWEVWLDGQEITQFTYFQQAGGINLDPVSVEITYGLERIGMALQGVKHFKDMLYAPGLTYGEIFLQNEFEQSTYNLDLANTDRVKQMFDLYEAEALEMIERGLSIPAYDYILKTSHTFNLLDARGAIGVTERAGYFNRIRNLSRQVANSWLETRQEMGFPLARQAESDPTVGTPTIEAGEWTTDGKSDFVLEIGCEELPAEYVDIALAALRDKVPTLLQELRLSYDQVLIEGTPRRLVVYAFGLANRQTDKEETVRGPAAKAAYDAEGKPTRALEGFAKSKGISVEKLFRTDVGGVEYVFGVVRETGKAAGDVLAVALPGLLGGLPWPRAMRWNDTNVPFGRPLRWLVALLNEGIVPFAFAGVVSERTSRGLRVYGSPPVEIPDAREYISMMELQGAVIRQEERANIIRNTARAMAQEVGGQIPTDAEAALLGEITNLVEAPFAIRGTYDEKYLELPREVLVTVMRKHQRYFPVEGENGKLLPYFITIANGTVAPDSTRTGNEEVIKARYSDATFFWERDRKEPLEAFRPKTAGLTFEAQLGSMEDKSTRLGKTVPLFAESFGLSADEQRAAERAAYLAKADLVTQMVMDFTSLQGIMGRHYAWLSGEDEWVANALEEQYHNNAPSPVGMVLGLADRLDSLVGLFAIGKAPKSTTDPFALRRAAIGVVELLLNHSRRFDLREGIEVAALTQPVPVSQESEREVLDFISRRLEQILLDRGLRHDVVKAALAARSHDPAGALESATQLAAVADDEAFKATLTAFARPARITRGKGSVGEVDASLFEHDEEGALWQAYQQAAGQVTPDSTVEELLAQLHDLRGPIDAFFDKVFVMADDEGVRANRLALLKHIADLPRGVVELSEVQGF